MTLRTPAILTLLATVTSTTLLALDIHRRPHPPELTSAAPTTPPNIPPALFLLLRTQATTDEVFTCPSSHAERDNFGPGTTTPINRSNFTDIAKNLSYSYADLPTISPGYRLNNSLAPEFSVTQPATSPLPLPHRERE